MPVPYSEHENVRGLYDYISTNSSDGKTTTITMRNQVQQTRVYQSGYRARCLLNDVVVGEAVGVNASSVPMDWTTIVDTGNISGNNTTYSRKKSAYTVKVGFDYYGEKVDGWSGGSYYGSASANVTIPALPSYAVTYNANGGSGAPSSQTKWHGEALTLSSTKPTRTGYAFQGWNTKSNGTGVNYTSGASYTANAALALYAVWKPNELTISYDGNGGTSLDKIKQVKKYNADLVLYTEEEFASNGASVKRTGHTFDCWNTESGGGGTKYAFGDTYTDNSKIGSGNAETTLYAQWNKKTYEVVLDPNGGELGDVPASLTKSYNDNLILPTEEPTREQWNFLGWSDSVASANAGVVLYGKGEAYTDDSPLIPDNQTITSITLYAVWELAYISPTISNLRVRRSNGAVDDDNGTYIHLTGDWSVDTSIQADALADNLLIEYKVSDVEQWIEASNTNPNTQSGTIDMIIGDGTILPGESYYVRVTVTDWGGSKSSKAILPQQFRLWDAGNKGKSLAIGQVASEDDSAFDIALPTRFHNDTKFSTGVENALDNDTLGNIPMKGIIAGEDLNDYKTVGFYYSDYTVVSGDGIFNIPAAIGDISFTLEVLYGGGRGALMQRLTSCDMDNQIVCQRMFYGDVWGDWQDVTFNGQKVLWSHPRGIYMNADQSATLSETISQQQNGIVLVFSAFDEENVTALDYQWQFKFIPKHFALQNYTTTSANKGVGIVLAAKAFQYITTKYLYIYDETIQGDETNGLNGTADCGITYNNTHWVLRYVLGC